MIPKLVGSPPADTRCFPKSFEDPEPGTVMFEILGLGSAVAILAQATLAQAHAFGPNIEHLSSPYSRSLDSQKS